jgi:hypothetical protein
VTRFSTVLRRRRRLTAALVAALALALPVAGANARPAKWSAPAAPAKWSPPKDANGPVAAVERSSWT